MSTKARTIRCLSKAAQAVYEAQGKDKATGRSWENATEGDKHYALVYAAAAVQAYLDAINADFVAGGLVIKK